MTEFNLIDELLKSYNLTRYKVAEVEPTATQQRLSDTNKKPLGNYKTDIVISLAKAISTLKNEYVTPGQILDKLDKIEKEKVNKMELLKIKELQADIERGSNGASIKIWENKHEFFDNLRTNNDPDVDWEDFYMDELNDFTNDEYVIEVNNGNGEPDYVHISQYDAIYGSI